MKGTICDRCGKATTYYARVVIGAWRGESTMGSIEMDLCEPCEAAVTQIIGERVLNKRSLVASYSWPIEPDPDPTQERIVDVKKSD